MLGSLPINIGLVTLYVWRRVHPTKPPEFVKYSLVALHRYMVFSTSACMVHAWVGSGRWHANIFYKALIHHYIIRLISYNVQELHVHDQGDVKSSVYMSFSVYTRLSDL